MKKTKLAIVLLTAMVILSSCSSNKTRTISVEEYRSKMQAGWLGQMAGVGWGGPTEIKFKGAIIPEDKVPVWKTTLINQHWQDDIYVEMTFLKTLENYGFDVDIRQAGIDFANSGYMLWHANKNGRANLRAGIAPPYSGHPKYNTHADDIDYQIEADYSGLIAPGMPQAVIDLGEVFGRLMNYGDGLYGGQFVGAMYAEAFFETDINKIIEAGLAVIPAESQFYETIVDVINWHKENPTDWTKTWELVEAKYNRNPDYRKFSCKGHDSDLNIDAKINAAYIVMGLLYGEGDMDKTIIVSMRCGQDSDCNPSNAAGILATSLGMENLPEKFRTDIDNETKFSFTAYNFPSLINVCEKLVREAVLLYGGEITEIDGKESFVIPVQTPVFNPVVQCWEPEEITEDVHFTAEEMEKITYKVRNKEDMVTVWKIAGPYSKEGVNGLDLFDVAFAPEKQKSFRAWETLAIPEGGFGGDHIDFNQLYKQDHCVVYLKTEVFFDEAQTVKLEAGSDDGLKVWLNGQLAYENDQERGHVQGSDIFDVDVKKGWNTIMFKVNQGVGGWGASLFIADTDRKLIEDLKFR